MGSRLKRIWILVFACCPSVVLADGVILNGLSARSLGRGGTNIAHRDNGAILFDNPAAMTRIDGDGLFDVGGNILISDFRYADPDNPRSRSTEVTPLPQIAAIRRTRDGVWAFGLGVFTPAGFTTSHTLQRAAPHPLAGEHQYESFGALVKILPGIAWQPTDRLSVGGTLGVGISRAELEGPYFLQSPPLMGTPTVMDLRGTGAALIYSVGLQYELTDRTTLGLTYQSESRFKLDGRADVEVPGMGQTRYDADARITWPRSLGGGVRHQVTPRQVFSADVIWYNWSSAFDEFEITLTDSPMMFPDIDERFPLNWRDTVSVRLGYEWDLKEAGIFRLGYVYHRNPIPRGTLTPFIPATMSHGVSTGYGFRFHDWEVDLSYMFVFGPERRVGTSDLIGGDFDNSRNRGGVHAISASLIKYF
jgi:long-chain fatty acid transport protein